MHISSMEIREPAAAEHGQVVGLLRRQLTEHSLRPPDDVLAATAREILVSPRRARILVAVLAGEIVGTAVLSFVLTLEHGGLGAWLEELYVEPHHRARGIGTRLVQAACALASAAGAHAVDLEVEAGHERVGHLYRRCGFRRHRRERWFLPLGGAHGTLASGDGTVPGDDAPAVTR